MGILKPIGKAAKFTTVTMPMSIFGWQLNKRLFFWTRSFWTQSVNPACPQCEEGVLLGQRDTEPVAVIEQGERGTRQRKLYPWVCNHCGYELMEELDQKRVRATAGRLRMERAQSVFSELELAEREAFARRHKIASRIFYVVALLMFANGVRMLATGTSLILTLNWGSFALMFFVFGMKRSYRSWQVMSGHIFESGAARHWFRYEKWLI